MKVVVDGVEYVNKEDYKEELLDLIKEQRKDFEQYERVQDGFDISERAISNS